MIFIDAIIDYIYEFYNPYKTLYDIALKSLQTHLIQLYRDDKLPLITFEKKNEDLSYTYKDVINITDRKKILDTYCVRCISDMDVMFKFDHLFSNYDVYNKNSEKRILKRTRPGLTALDK